MLRYSNCILALLIPAWNIALVSGVLLLILLFSIWLPLDPLSLCRKVASLSLFYLYYFGHCPDELAACIPPPVAQPHSTDRHQLTTIIVWNSPVHELIGTVMVSSLLLPAVEFSPIFCISRFLPSKGRSVTTGPDGIFFFFSYSLYYYSSFEYFISLFYSHHCRPFPFLKGCRFKKGHIVSVLCSHSLEKKKARDPGTSRQNW